MKYIKVYWPEIQDYMDHPDYNKEVSYDPRKNCWFVPDEWEERVNIPQSFQEWKDSESGGDIGDLEDAMG